MKERKQIRTMLRHPEKDKIRSRLTVRPGLKVRLISRLYNWVIYNPGVLRASVTRSG